MFDTTLSPAMIRAQLLSYVGWRVRIKVRPARRYNKCQDCGTVFHESNNLSCEKHGRWAKWVYLDLHSPELTGGRASIHRWNGQRLTYESALLLVSKIKDEDERGVFNFRFYVDIDPRDVRFDVYYERYKKHLCARAERGKYSRHNFDVIKSLFKVHLLKYFASVDIRDISRGAIIKWNEQHKASDKIKNKAMKALREMLNWAHENEDRATKAPVMPFVETPEIMPVGLTINQQEEIIAKIEPRHQNVFRFLANTGHRPSVVCGLQVGDVNLEEGIYTTRRRLTSGGLVDGLKTKKRQEISYPTTHVEELLKEAVRGRITWPESFLFMYKGKRGKGQWRRYTSLYLSTVFRKARDKAGYPNDVTLYSFTRHSMASQLAEGGASDGQIAMVLDNSEVMVRRHYKNVFPQTLDNVLQLRKRDGKVETLPTVADEEK